MEPAVSPLDDAFRELLGRLAAAPRERICPAVERLEGAFGATLDGPLRAYFESYGHSQIRGVTGFAAYDDESFGLPDAERGNVFVQMMSNRLGLIASFTGSIYLGSDGGGLDYFACATGPSGEVAVYDPGLGDLRLLADSLPALAGLLSLLATWDDHAEARGIDTGEVIDGGVSVDLDDPELASIARLLEALRGHVHLPGYEESDVCSAFDELVRALVGEPLSIGAQTPLVADYERARPLVEMLSQLGVDTLPTDAAPTDAYVRQQDALYWLWRAWFAGDEASLAEGLARCADHGSALVRDAAAFLGAFEEAPDAHPAWSHLSVLRRLAGTPLPAGSSPPEALSEVMEARPEDDDRRAKLKELLRAKPGRTDVLDNLAYAYFGDEDWERMLVCADASIASQPGRTYPWLQRGIALLELGRHRDALEAFDHGLCFGFDATLWLDKAITWLALGDREAAIANLMQLPSAYRVKLIRETEELASVAEEVARRSGAEAPPGG